MLRLMEAARLSRTALCGVVGLKGPWDLATHAWLYSYSLTLIVLINSQIKNIARIKECIPLET